MRFPPDFIERLKSHTSISQVIGKRIPVKKFGREFKALCPFHNEKSPSFTINDEKEFFHCFGCGAHGDAIGFIKDYEKLTYVEAVERLAAEAGVPLPAISPREEERYRKALSLYDAVEEAALWYQKQFVGTAGTEARRYLEARGIGAEMIAQFRLGFAPDSRDALKLHLMQKNFTEAQLIECGMLARSEDGRVYDRFRNRIMFPICTATGKVVAFSARILPSAEQQVRAKYLNSPETPLFKKGDLLFGLNLARRAIADTGSALVVEGNLDVVALHQAGFTHAVAPLGTALTPEQLQALWRLTPEPVLCMDGDSAGQRAMLRAAEIALPLLKAGNGLKFATLPPGEDPDSLIKRSGAEAMRAVLDKAWTLSEILWNTNASQIGHETPEQIARLESMMNAVTEKLADTQLRAHFKDYFKQQLWTVKRPAKGKKRVSKEKQAGPSVLALAGQRQDKRSSGFEMQIFCLLLHQPSLLHNTDIEEEFARMAFGDKQLDKLREAILEHTGSTEATSCETLKSFLATSGHSDTSDRIRKQHSVSVPKFLRSESVNMHDAISAWRQLLATYAHTTEHGNDNAPIGEDNWERYRERAMGDLPQVAHFVFPEEN